MEQNSSEADSSVSTSTGGKFVLDEWSVSKFRSRRNVDSFLTKFPHAMFPEMPISCWRPVKQFWRPSSDNVLFLISCLLLVFLSWVRFRRGKGNMKVIKLSSLSSMHLTEDILLTYRNIRRVARVKHLDKLFVKISLRIYAETNCPSDG